MRVLTPRPVGDRAALAAVVAGCLDALEPGLRLVERAARAGEVMVDLACADGRNRPVLIVCEVTAGAGAVLRALEGMAWWREHPAGADAGPEPRGAPRAMLVAGRFDDRALRLLRALGPVAPAAVECRVFDDAGRRLVSLERIDPAAAGPAPAETPALGTAPAPAMPPDVGRPAAEPVATAPEPAPAGGAEAARRARALVERLERWRLSEAFR